MTQKLRHGIEAIPGLKILGDPKVCIVAFDSDEFHIYRVADEMKVNSCRILKKKKKTQSLVSNLFCF